MLARLAAPAACVESVIRELGHDPYPWGVRDGYRHTTACRHCGATAEAVEVDGMTYAEGAATLTACPISAVRHLTLTGYYAGRPVCGAPAETKGAGSMHAAYWNPGEHGRDFCAGCMTAVEAVMAETGS